MRNSLRFKGGLILAVLLAVFLTACGGGDNGEDGNGNGNITITEVRSFTETFANHPGGRPDGWYLHLKADVENPSGVPENIQAVTAVNLDTNIDPNTYTLKYSSGVTYKKHPEYTNQNGTYHFTVINNQGETAEADAAPIDNPMQLGVIQNLRVFDNSTTPTFSFDTLANADKYSLSIFDSSLTKIYTSNKSDTSSFDVPTGVMTEGETYYLRAEALDINKEDGDGVNDVENRSLNYMAFTPGKPFTITITKVQSFTETVVNYPGGGEDGWYLHLLADVDDLLGVPDNIASVTAVNLDTQIDPNTYTLNYFPGDIYIKHPVYTNQRGTYRFTVTNKQGETVVLDAAPIDNPIQLGVIQNLQVSDNSTTPTFSFNTLANADKYSLVIWDSSFLTIYSNTKPTTTSFDVPAGIMAVGETYYLIAVAANYNYDDGDEVNDIENLSTNFMAFTPVSD